jgi:hypothetical protein
MGFRNKVTYTDIHTILQRLKDYLQLMIKTTFEGIAKLVPLWVYH